MIPYNKIIKYKKAFTLSEVLITLGVIGIIAAMTIPTLMKNYEQAQFKTAWKKAYSNISNATNLLIKDNGGSLMGVLNFSATPPDDTVSQFGKYIKFVKTGNYSTTEEKCWSKITYNMDGTVQSSTVGEEWRKCAQLEDGTLLYFFWFSSTCEGATAQHPSGICQAIQVDVNGFKRPNTVGKDIFGLWVEKDKVVPMGTVNDHINYTRCDNVYGMGCSAVYLYK